SPGSVKSNLAGTDHFQHLFLKRIPAACKGGIGRERNRGSPGQERSHIEKTLACVRHCICPPDNVIDIPDNVAQSYVSSGIVGRERNKIAKCRIRPDSERFFPCLTVIEKSIAKTVEVAGFGIEDGLQCLAPNFKVLGLWPLVAIGV